MTRSRWVALVVALVVGVLVVHVAAGWYFASAMQQDAFTVRPSVVNKDLRVTAVGGGTISLAETGTEEPSLRQDEVYGLAWEGGFGRISGAPRESSAGAGETGQGTTRSFTVLTGQPPTVGAAAGLQVYAYPPDPVATWGDAVQELSCPGPAGALREVYLPGRGDTWVVLVHGKGADVSETFRAADAVHRAGLPALAITYRGDVGAVPDPSGRYGYGTTEWADLQAALDCARAHGAKQVQLYGVSMGASIIAETLTRDPQPGFVGGIVLDAPLLDLQHAVELAAANRHVPPTITWTALQIAALVHGVRWASLDHLSDPTWLTVPTLVFHGADDRTVPVSDSEELRAKRPDLVQLVVTPGADHVESWNRDPAAYDRRLVEFVTSG